MQAIEFEAQINNGSIEVPAEYRDYIKGLVRVIVVSTEQSSGDDFIDELLKNPIEIEDFRPLTREEIYTKH